MLTTTLAVFAVLGVLLGLAGMATGMLAFRRSQAIAEDALSAARDGTYVPTSDGGDLRAIRDVALIRYDALEEMSGAHSFSLALLNSTGDGVVLTSINSRTETRTYAKVVSGGSPVDTLSPEEYRAVRAARLGCGVGNSVPEPERKRRWEEPTPREKLAWEESTWEESTWKESEGWREEGEVEEAGKREQEERAKEGEREGVATEGET